MYTAYVLQTLSEEDINVTITDAEEIGRRLFPQHKESRHLSKPSISIALSTPVTIHEKQDIKDYGTHQCAVNISPNTWQT